MDDMNFVRVQDTIKTFVEMHDLKRKAISSCDKTVNGLIDEADIDPDGLFLSTYKDNLKYEFEKVSFVSEHFLYHSSIR